MEWAGLFFEVILLAFGVYVYLFAIGKITSKDPKTQEKMEQWRSNNAWWLRLGALALVAMMLVNIVLHLQQIF